MVHPVLVAAFPALSLYTHNVYETPAAALAGPLALSVAGAAAAWLVLGLLARDPARAGLVTSLLAALFFGFARWNDALDAVVTGSTRLWVSWIVHVPAGWVGATMAAVAVPAIWAIHRRLGDPARWTRGLNAFALVLVLLPASTIARARLREPATAAVKTPPPSATASRVGRRPDVYFIVLDAYARSDVMKDLFGFDNGPFLAHLRDRGFFVAGRSTSNYAQTRLSIASTLNLDYLDRLLDPASRDPNPLTGLVADNAVVRALRPLGYRFVAFSSNYEPTECPGADEYIAPSFPARAFHRAFAAMTPLGPYLYPEQHADFYTAHRDRILFDLDRLPALAREPGPKFVFAHIVCPHHPFCFDEDGRDVSPHHGTRRGHAEGVRGEDGAAYREGYRRQAAFITRRVVAAIDRILDESPGPPIIVLASDHGSGLHHDIDSLEKTDLRERFANLTCVHFPDRDYAMLDDAITPVNLFRAVLDAQFAAGLPKLPRRNLFSTGADPLEFTDVTGRLGDAAPPGR